MARQDEDNGFGKSLPAGRNSTKVSDVLITFDETFESVECPDDPVLNTHILSKCGLTAWNLKFDGHSDVRDFISAVEELQAARGITERLLLANFHDLLSEPILTWFRVNRFQVTSWPRLRALLYDNFLPVDYTYQIVSQLRAKKQSEDQSLWEFVSQMRFLANKIPNSLSESDFFEIIKHNMLPKYHAAIIFGSVVCVDDLVRIGKLTDAYSLGSVNKTVNIPVNNLFPRVNNNSSSNVVRSSQERKQLAVCASVSAPRPSTGACFVCKQVGHFSRQCPTRSNLDINCFKCQQHGHRYSQCPNIRIPMCLGCKTMNVTKKTCPNCNIVSKTVIATPAVCAARATESTQTQTPAPQPAVATSTAATPRSAGDPVELSRRRQPKPSKN